MKKELIVFLSVAAICLTLVGISWNVKNTGISIQNMGTSSDSVQNSISVSGDGKITATPDIVRIRAGITETAKTTKEAQTAANQKLNTILTVLEKNGVEKKDIQTDNLSIRPEYDWKEKGRELLGQRVSQDLNVKIRGIDKDAEKVTKILDELGEINGLELNSVNFDIEDKKEFFSKAREQAFDKAKQKAEEYAKFSGLTLLKPISIRDNSVQWHAPMFSNFAKAEIADEAGSGSSLPAGELEVTADVDVIFGVK